MILYHGSNVEINEIDLSICKPYKELTNKISFHTKNAIETLTKVGVVSE